MVTTSEGAFRVEEATIDELHAAIKDGRTTLVAVVRQSAVFVVAGMTDPFVVAEGALGMVFAAAISLYACDRTVRLVSAFSDEQTRRERLGRYFSPLVAEHLAEHVAIADDPIDGRDLTGRGEIGLENIDRLLLRADTGGLRPLLRHLARIVFRPTHGRCSCERNASSGRPPRTVFRADRGREGCFRGLQPTRHGAGPWVTVPPRTSRSWDELCANGSFAGQSFLAPWAIQRRILSRSSTENCVSLFGI